jgi:hypothetical protein
MSEHPRDDRARNQNDSNSTDQAERTPGQQGVSGGNLQRNIASRAEEEHEVDDKTGVTRVRKGDKADEGAMPTLPNRS